MGKITPQRRQLELLGRELSERAAAGDLAGMARVEPGLFPKGIDERLARAAAARALGAPEKALDRIAGLMEASEGRGMAKGEDFWRLLGEEGWRAGEERAFLLSAGKLGKGWSKAALEGKGISPEGILEALGKTVSPERMAGAIWGWGFGELLRPWSGKERSEAERERGLEACEMASARMGRAEASEALRVSVERWLSRGGDPVRAGAALRALGNRGARWDAAPARRGASGYGRSPLDLAWESLRGESRASLALSEARKAMGPEAFWSERRMAWIKNRLRSAGDESAGRLAAFAEEEGMPSEWARVMFEERMRGICSGAAENAERMGRGDAAREIARWGWGMEAGSLWDMALDASLSAWSRGRPESGAESGTERARIWAAERRRMPAAWRERLEAFELELVRAGWTIPFGTEDLEGSGAPEHERARMEKLLLSRREALPDGERKATSPRRGI